LIRKLWYYVAYNAEKLTESDAEEIETEIRQTMGDNDMPTLAQIYIDKGMEKERAAAILRTLAKRFQTVPKLLEERILAVSDLEHPGKLADFAFDRETFAEFEDFLKK
jgi:hypothetical protein